MWLMSGWLVAAGWASTSVEVVVPGVRNGEGSVGCRLFAAAEGFPSDGAAAVQQVMAPIVDGAARCTFGDVPARWYAVAVMHDEDGDQVLDSNFLGMPTEGYGVSNNKTYAMASPRWDESRFEVTAGVVSRLTIQLRY